MSRIGICPLRQMGEVLVHTKYEQKEEGKEKGSNVPKSCLESSPGVVTAENASPEHKSHIKPARILSDH
ncbi:hypothetical protein J6590_042363 [Homalodisca vitripennis]|nr:hypothetical protein J6590_042363 [Homalodisca vitripennis]